MQFHIFLYNFCSRLAAGFAWPWKAKKDDSVNDVKIQDKEYHWNRTTTAPVIGTC